MPTIKNHQARFAARSVGVDLLPIGNDFFLFSRESGEQLGYDFDEPWTADDVLDYCEKFKIFLRTGVFNT